MNGFTEEKTKEVAIEREKTMALVKLLVLIGLASLAPIISFHNQFISGPIVNAILFIAVYMVGFNRAVLVGLVPSLFALLTGLLPFVLGPIIPFIMLGNILLMYVFDKLKYKNYWLAMVSASIAKFILLWASGWIVIDFLIKKELAGAVMNIVGYYQLITALLGGILAWLFLRFVILQFKKK